MNVNRIAPFNSTFEICIYPHISGYLILIDIDGCVMHVAHGFLSSLISGVIILIIPLITMQFVNWLTITSWAYPSRIDTMCILHTWAEVCNRIVVRCREAACTFEGCKSQADMGVACRSLGHNLRPHEMNGSHDMKVFLTGILTAFIKHWHYIVHIYPWFMEYPY